MDTMAALAALSSNLRRFKQDEQILTLILEPFISNLFDLKLGCFMVMVLLVTRLPIPLGTKLPF